MSLIFFNIIKSIRDKYSWFQGEFYLVMLIIVGVSPCHHGDSADHGNSADH